jgi:predicted HicB family RNase H-like nuclease
MQLTPYIDALLADLSSLAALGDESTAQAAERLGHALRSSAGLRLLDLLAEAALEVSDQLPAGQVEVRLAGQEPSLVYVEAEPEHAAAAPEQGMDARISLRLPETLKAAAEAAATREGLSVNAWIVRSLKRSLDTPTRRPGRRLTGFGES